MNIRERIEEEMGDIPEEQAIQEYLGISKIIGITYPLIADQISEYIQLKQGPVLDLGSGLGNLAIEIGRRYPHVSIIGLDISEGMAEKAGKSLKGSTLKNIKFIVGDAHSMDFDDESIELIVSHGAVHHWRDAKTVLKEIHRVLMPDGLAYISDLRRDAPMDVVGQVTDMLNKNQAKAFTNSVNASYLPDEIKSILADLDITNYSIQGQKFSRKTIAENMEILRRAPVKSNRFNELYLTLMIQK